MYPRIHFFGFHVPTFAFCIFLGIVAFLIYFKTIFDKKEKIDQYTTNRMFLISIAGIIILYVCAFFFNSLFHSIEEGKIVIGGITWLGGIFGTIPCVMFLIHKFVPKAKGRELELFSLIIPGIILAHGFGRLGCFFGGCCYGGVTDSIFGVVFPKNSPAALTYPSPTGESLPVLPTQLFEAFFEFLLFAILMLLYKKTKTKNLEIYLITYSIFRFAIEFLRGDDRGELLFIISPTQFLCILCIIAAVLIILFKKNIIFHKLYEKCIVWQNEAKHVKTKELKIFTGERHFLKLEKLHEMYKKGIISEDEYLKKKEEILQRI